MDHSSAYSCDMFLYVNTFVKNNSLYFFTDPLRVIKDGMSIWNAGVFRDLTQCGDAKYIICVLFSFNLRRFWIIHSWISAIQCSKFFKEEEKFNSLSWSSDIYSCVSSAYKWYLIPYSCAMISRGRVYIVKTRGSRTEHCGTPDNKNWTSDKIRWTDTLWKHYSR